MKEYLTEKEEQTVERIVADSNLSDGTGYTAPLDADLYYLSRHEGRIVSFLAVYFMGDTVKGRAVEELVLFTAPEYRRHGRAGKLFCKYRKERKQASDSRFPYNEFPAQADSLPGGSDTAGIFVPDNDAAPAEGAPLSVGNVPVIRFSAYPAAVSAAFLTKIGAEHDHDEVLMRRHLGANGGKELEERDFRMANTYSECCVKTYGTVGYIYGVRTDAGHLRQGSAASLLHDVFAKLYGLGAEDAVLEVSSANIPAYRLYQKLQFEARESLQIWNCY